MLAHDYHWRDSIHIATEVKYGTAADYQYAANEIDFGAMRFSCYEDIIILGWLFAHEIPLLLYIRSASILVLYSRSMT